MLFEKLLEKSTSFEKLFKNPNIWKIGKIGWMAFEDFLKKALWRLKVKKHKYSSFKAWEFLAEGSLKTIL